VMSYLIYIKWLINFMSALIMYEISKKKLFFIVFISIFFISCQKKKQENELNENTLSSKTQYNEKSNIALGEIVSDDGCLNISLYASAMKSLNLTLPVWIVSTELDFDSKNFLRQKFKALLAYSNFQFENKSISDILELFSYQQIACDGLIYKAPNGIEENFKIIKSSRKMITAESSLGERIEFEWLSPQIIKIKTRQITFDFPCTSHEAYIENTKIINWESPPTEYLTPKGFFWVNKNYLQLIADAVGATLEDFYQMKESDDVSSERQKVLVLSKIKEIVQLPVQQNLLSCDSSSISD